MNSRTAHREPTRRTQLALTGALAQRDLSPDEARHFDAAVAARIDDAVAHADFSSAALPDFAAVLPDPHLVLVDLAARVGTTNPPHRLREALTHVERVADY